MEDVLRRDVRGSIKDDLPPLARISVLQGDGYRAGQPAGFQQAYPTRCWRPGNVVGIWGVAAVNGDFCSHGLVGEVASMGSAIPQRAGCRARVNCSHGREVETAVRVGTPLHTIDADSLSIKFQLPSWETEQTWYPPARASDLRQDGAAGS